MLHRRFTLLPRRRLSPGRDCRKLALTAPDIDRKDEFPFRRFLRWLGKVSREGCDFGGAGPVGRKVLPIRYVVVAAVRRRVPALHRRLHWAQAREKTMMGALGMSVREKEDGHRLKPGGDCMFTLHECL
jgi:hypothetical protein